MKTPILLIKTILLENRIEICTSQIPYANRDDTYIETMVFVNGKGVKRFNNHIEALQSVIDGEVY